MAWNPYDPCPCGCGVIGWKLAKKLPGDDEEHVVGCSCIRHRNKRNQKKGHAAQAKMHKALGGTGFTPHNEESGRPYQVEVIVMPESKAGAQVPASWTKFRSTDWFRRALNQSERAVPVGTGVIPALVIDGRWLIADLRPTSGERVGT